MHVLFVALFIYIVGVALVVYIRPSIMFRPGGTWKEFSLNASPNHTVLPFWLFTILWAIISYCGGVLIAQASIIRAVHEPSFDDVEFETPSLQMPSFLSRASEPELAGIHPVSKSMGMDGTSRNGFYVLDTHAKTPMYVYYGPEPPSRLNVDA